MISCEHCRDELAEYALGHSSAEASAAIDEHLAACPVCRGELAAVEAAWSGMAAALPPAPTSREEAWQRVARQIDADAAPPPPPDRAVAPSPAALTPRQRILSYVVAASVLVALGGGALWLRLGMPTTRPADRLAVYALLDLTERLEELQKLEQRIAEEEMRLRSLKPVQSIRGARAYILWDVPARQWHFFALGLPPAPAGQTYQLWAAAENAPPAPGPTFEVDAEGSDAVVADFPDLPPETPVRALVTLEPLGGSAAPTGPTVLEAAL